MQLREELIYDLDTCLTDYEHDLCEGLFMKEELFTALLGLQTGKSAGSDGLPPCCSRRKEYLPSLHPS